MRRRSLAPLAFFCLVAGAARAAPPAPPASPGASQAPSAPLQGPSAAPAPSGSSSEQGAPGAAPAWQTWPSGRPFGSEVQRPGDGAMTLCGFEQPVCVHARLASQGPRALEVLASAERAMATLGRLARLPRPFPDGNSGGSPALDLYLAPLPGVSYRVGFEPPSSFPIDRASAFGLLDERLGEGCARATAVHRLVATAMLSAVDGGEAGGDFASTAAYLAMMNTGCTTQALEAIDRSQAHPERPAVPDAEADEPRASPLWPWFLDGVIGAGAPGSLLAALWYGGQQSTPIEATRYRNDPDLFAVVGRVARAEKQSLSDVLLDFSVWRAFLGDRDDGQHFPEAAFVGPFGRPKFDVLWPYKSLPRRVAFTPLEPTGAVYAWVDLEGAPEHPQIGLHAEWEPPITMRWAVVRVDADGGQISRIDLLNKRGDVSADQRVVELEGAKGLLIVGVSGGEVTLDHPYKIDEAPYERHGGTLHVFAE